MKSFMAFLLALCSFDIAAAPSFFGKSMPELLQYTGARCAYEVVVEKTQAEKPAAYAAPVTARQLARYGEVSELDPKLSMFNVVATNNLRKDNISSDDGDDYYARALSLADLKVGEKYLLLCRGNGIFEALSDTPENAYKLKVFMAFNWEKTYATKTSLTQLKQDLGDLDLATTAYNALQKRQALNDQLMIEALRGQTDNRLLYLHLAKLSGERYIGELEEAPALKTAAQMDFVCLLLSQLKENDVQKPLFEAFNKILSSDELLVDLNQTKIDILMAYLNLFRTTYRNQMAIHNRLIEKIIPVTIAVPSYNARFLEPVLLYAATAPSIRKTVNTYISSLDSLERIRFLNRLLGLFEPMARARIQPQSPRQIAEVLAEHLPLNPSGLYLRSLASFNPYVLEPKIPDEAALKKLLASKIDPLQMRQQTQWLTLGVNLVMNTLNAILKKSPETKTSVKAIGERYVGEGNAFAMLVELSIANQYKKLMQAVPQQPPTKVASGGK